MWVSAGAARRQGHRLLVAHPQHPGEPAAREPVRPLRFLSSAATNTVQGSRTPAASSRHQGERHVQHHVRDRREVADYENDDLRLDLRWWDALNLTVGQIYLQGDALLRDPLAVEHIKPRRLLGHWGTSPGLSMIYVLLNRADQPHRLRLALGHQAPGHGGPSLWPPPTWNTYSEVYPTSPRTPPVSSPCSASSHRPAASQPCERADPRQHPRGRRARGTRSWRAVEGGDGPPQPLRPCVIGDGEAETGPLSASWRLYFLNPRRDGAVLPILHLNGYKIAGPTVLGRTSDEDAGRTSAARAGTRSVSGDDPEQVFRTSTPPRPQLRADPGAA